MFRKLLAITAALSLFSCGVSQPALAEEPVFVDISKIPPVYPPMNTAADRRVPYGPHIIEGDSINVVKELDINTAIFVDYNRFDFATRQFERLDAGVAYRINDDTILSGYYYRLDNRVNSYDGVAFFITKRWTINWFHGNNEKRHRSK